MEADDGESEFEETGKGRGPRSLKAAKGKKRGSPLELLKRTSSADT